MSRKLRPSKPALENVSSAFSPKPGRGQQLGVFLRELGAVLFRLGALRVLREPAQREGSLALLARLHARAQPAALVRAS